MPAVIESPRPFYVRYYAGKAAVTHPEPFAVGKAEVLSQGADVAILAFGFLLREAERARAILSARGLSVRLVNLRTLEPIDEAVVIDALRGTRLTVTVEDHLLRGGLYSIVAELALTRGVTGRVLPLALPGRWFTPALLPRVLETEGFTGEAIASRITAALNAHEES
jgi:transketolase